MILGEIARYIDDQSTAWTRGTNLFGAVMPETPNTAVALIEYGGAPPGWVFASTRPAYEQPRIQLISRSTSYATARRNADTLYRMLDKLHSTTLSSAAAASGARYLRVEAIQSPFSLGRDDSDRYNIVCNFSITKELST